MEVKEDYKTFSRIEKKIPKMKWNADAVKIYQSRIGEADEIQLVIQDMYEETKVYDLLQMGIWSEIESDLTDTFQDEIDVSLYIQKNFSKCILNVYDREAFSDYLMGQKIPDFFRDLWKTIEKYGKAAFYMPGESANFCMETESIIFAGDINRIKQKSDIILSERRNKTDKVREVSYVREDTTYMFWPEDFEIKGCKEKNELTDFFEHMELVLCIAYLCNYTEIREYSVKYEMRGYRVCEGEYCICDGADVSKVTEILSRIINWIFAEDSNIFDKDGIARNILSLHIKNSWMEVGYDAYTSIISGYKIYLKSSIDNYLHIKNEVVEKITNICERIMESADNYTGRIKNNLLALASFLITTLIVNTISSGKIENIFTRDIRYLTYAFLGISAGYIFVCRLEMDIQKKRIREIYEDSKMLYRDVLCEEDIRNIYGNDEIYKKGMERAISIVKKYQVFWICAACIIGIVVTVLGV